jgi:D-arabinose 1-dehydrogenase-like Zn-dependent alcohol dehydrogenase
MQYSMRVPGAFAYKIPEALGSAEAAPMLCAGITVGARGLSR